MRSTRTRPLSSVALLISTQLGCLGSTSTPPEAPATTAGTVLFWETDEPGAGLSAFSTSSETVVSDSGRFSLETGDAAPVVVGVRSPGASLFSGGRATTVCDPNTDVILPASYPVASPAVPSATVAVEVNGVPAGLEGLEARLTFSRAFTTGPEHGEQSTSVGQPAPGLVALSIPVPSVVDRWSLSIFAERADGSVSLAGLSEGLTLTEEISVQYETALLEDHVVSFTNGEGLEFLIFGAVYGFDPFAVVALESMDFLSPSSFAIRLWRFSGQPLPSLRVNIHDDYDNGFQDTRNFPLDASNETQIDIEGPDLPASALPTTSSVTLPLDLDPSSIDTSSATRLEFLVGAIPDSDDHFAFTRLHIPLGCPEPVQITGFMVPAIESSALSLRQLLVFPSGRAVSFSRRFELEGR